MLDPFPLVAPVMFAPGNAVHENVVPATFLGEGEMVTNAVWPLQMVKSAPDAVGNGFTLTTRSTGLPLQPLKRGVILYVTVPATLPVFTGVSPIVPVPEAFTEAALMGPLMVDIQEYVVPAIVDVGRKFSVSLLQICLEKSDALLVITGTGVTVTVTSTGAPSQPFAEGVILYTTVPLFTPSELVSACPMALPEPAAAPLTFVLLCTIHVNVVPATLFGFVMEIAVDCPEQIV